MRFRVSVRFVSLVGVGPSVIHAAPKATTAKGCRCRSREMHAHPNCIAGHAQAGPGSYIVQLQGKGSKSGVCVWLHSSCMKREKQGVCGFRFVPDWLSYSLSSLLVSVVTTMRTCVSPVMRWWSRVWVSRVVPMMASVDRLKTRRHRYRRNRQMMMAIRTERARHRSRQVGHGAWVR